MPTIHSLEIFKTIYENHNVTETSKLFYCSQPSISRTIKDLENEYHTLLFERFHHKLIPTESAHILYIHATQVLDSYNAMNQSMETRKEKIRIGSTVTISNTLLPSFIKQFQKENEKVQSEVTVSNGASLQDALLTNQLDIALIENDVTNNDLTSIVFDSDELILLVPKKHPLTKNKRITLKDLESYPFLHREQGSAVRQYLDQLFTEQNIHVDTIWQSRSTHALLRAVEEGLGITILPKKMCELEVKAHRITALEIYHTSLERNYYIVYHKEKKLTPILSSLIDICLK